MPTPAAPEHLLFVYGALMEGEPEHARLSGARAVGPAATEAAFELIDLGVQPALVAGGRAAVRGEVYALAPALLASIDLFEGHPLRFRRTPIRLDDGRVVEAYLLDADQVRGRRRIRSGDWKARFAPRPREEHAWSRWAKTRQ